MRDKQQNNVWVFYKPKQERLKELADETRLIAREALSESDNNYEIRQVISEIASLTHSVLYAVENGVKSADDVYTHERAAEFMCQVFSSTLWKTLIAKIEEEYTSDFYQREVMDALSHFWHTPDIFRHLIDNEHIDETNAQKILETLLSHQKHADYGDLNTTYFRSSMFREWMRKHYFVPATCGQMRYNDACNDGKEWMRDHLEEDTKYDVFDCYDADSEFRHEDFVLPLTNKWSDISDEEQADACENCGSEDCDGDCYECEGCGNRIADGDCCETCVYCEVCDETYNVEITDCSCSKCSHCGNRNKLTDEQKRWTNYDTCQCEICEECDENRTAGDCECPRCEKCRKLSDDKICEACDAESKRCAVCNEGQLMCACLKLVLPINSVALPNTEAMKDCYDGGELILLPMAA